MQCKLLSRNISIALLCTVAFHSFAFSQNVPKIFVNRSYMDTTVSPSLDFYRFANGNWLKNTTLPAEGYVMTSTTLLEQNNRIFNDLIQQIVKNPDTRNEKQMSLWRFYTSALNMDKSQQKSLAFVRQIFNKIDKISSHRMLQEYLIEQNSIPSFKIVELNGNEYDETSRIVKAEFRQSGIPIPNHFFINGTDSNTLILEEYRQLISDAFKIIKPLSDSQIDDIVALEKKLAFSHDTVANLKKYRINELTFLFPNIEWTLFSKHFEIPDTTVYHFYHVRYYETLNDLFKKVPISTWKNKLKSDFILFNSNRLSTSLGAKSFSLFEKHIRSSEKKFDPLEEVNSILQNFYSKVNLADMSGDLFARKVLSQENKARINAIANRIKETFLKRLQQNTWLQPTTKLRSINKLENMVFKIGYPEKVSGENLAFTKDNYIRNYFLLYKNLQSHYLLSTGKLKRRDTWKRDQWSIAASYQPDYNSFEIVAGFLQEPFFQREADDAVLYGSIGTIIAHEISHGFDNQGKDYDESGTKQNWWLPKDDSIFNTLIQPLIEQYSSYVVLDTVRLNGSLSVGENVADLLGIQIAFEAFTSTDQFKNNKVLDGFTPTQRFILSFAQQWRSKYTDEVLKEYFLQDVHPPDNIRINGTLVNFEPFYQSFNSPVESNRNRKSKVHIW